MSAPRVIIADPRRLLREAMAEMFRARYGLTVVSRTDDATSTILQAQRTPTDVVVMAGVNDWLGDVCGGLRELDPVPKALLIDGDQDDRTLLEAIVAGIDGYLTSASSMDEVVEAIRALARGDSVVPPAMLGPLLQGLIHRRRRMAVVAQRLEQLTRREHEVLTLLVDGLHHRDIGEVLSISPETARTHLQRILQKLEVHSRLEAIALVTDVALPVRAVSKEGA